MQRGVQVQAAADDGRFVEVDERGVQVDVGLRFGSGVYGALIGGKEWGAAVGIGRVGLVGAK